MTQLEKSRNRIRKNSVHKGEENNKSKEAKGTFFGRRDGDKRRRKGGIGKTQKN